MMTKPLHSQNDSSKVSRRKVLSTTAVIGVSGLAGCSDDRPQTDLTVPDRSEYFESVDYNPDPGIVGDYTELGVNLRPDAVQRQEINAVLLFFDGKQVDDAQIATGERSVTFAPLELDVETVRKTNTISVAVVTGGQNDGVNWVGGEILERVELNKKEQSE